MGLGLAICRMIVERHGGQLLASPSSKGAMFQIIMPVQSPAEASGPGSSELDQFAERDALLHIKDEITKAAQGGLIAARFK